MADAIVPRASGRASHGRCSGESRTKGTFLRSASSGAARVRGGLVWLGVRVRAQVPWGRGSSRGRCLFGGRRLVGVREGVWRWAPGCGSAGGDGHGGVDMCHVPVVASSPWRYRSMAAL